MQRLTQDAPAQQARRACLAVLAALAALLSSCTTLAPVDDAPAALELPSGWRAADGAGAGAVTDDALRAWWLRFDDPRMAALVGQALQANTGVQLAQAALRQAQALREVDAAAMWPRLDSSASAQRGLAQGRSTGNALALGLDATWSPDVWGAVRAGVDARDAVVAASAASLGDVQVQVAAETALAYILLRSTQLRLALAASTVDSQVQTLQITQWREQAGLVSALPSEQARTAVQQSRAQLPLLQASLQRSVHALAVLTGQPPAALQDLGDAGATAAAAGTGMGAGTGAAEPGLPQARDDPALTIPAHTLRQRADVRAAELQVAAALARLGQARAQRWPSFALGGSLGLGAATLTGLGQRGALLGQLLAGVQLPLLDGGAQRAQVRVQQAALAQAQQAYHASVLGALKAVEDALVALREDRQRLALLRLAADAATRAATLANQRYRSGLVDFQAVLETQRALYTTRDSVITAAADLGGDQVRLFTALGGGWPMADAAPPR